MRPMVVIWAASSVVAGSVFTPAFAAPAVDSTLGGFTAPFREDGFTRDYTGCVPDGKGQLSCLPAGASVVALPDGRILYWNSLEGTENIPLGSVPQGADKTVVDENRILSLNLTDPKASKWTPPANSSGVVNKTPHPLTPLPDHDPNSHLATLFCADQKLLPDGRVLTVGGTDYYNDPALGLGGVGALELEGVRATRIFDPTDNTWHEAAPMHHGRWYPSMVTLADGSLFVASGVTKLIKPIYPDAPLDSGANVRPTETYDVASNTWTENVDGAKSLPLFPRLHLLPNGKVFYDAAGQVFNPLGQSVDEVLWNFASVYDPKAPAGVAKWRNVGVPGVGSLAPGFRGSTFSAALRLDPPYDTARFLTGGGILGTSPGSYLAMSDSRISEVKIGADGTEKFTTHPTGAMNNARWYSTAVPLPDGTVMAFSGADVDEVLLPGTEQPIRQAELFTPSADGTTGTWKKMAVASQGRTYHNTAMLLPDGRVLVGGHAPIPNGYTFVHDNPDIPGIRDFGNNNRDASFEIFSPPYIGRSDRPSITSVPSIVGRGSALTVGLNNASGIDSVVIMRNTAETHLVDADGRTVSLAITGRDAKGVTVAVPANPAVLPPGPYLVFVNRKASDGTIVPSVGAQVFVGTASVPGYVADPAGNIAFAQASGARVADKSVEAAPSGASASGGVTRAAPNRLPRTGQALAALAMLGAVLAGLGATARGAGAASWRRRRAS